MRSPRCHLLVGNGIAVVVESKTNGAHGGSGRWRWVRGDDVDVLARRSKPPSRRMKGVRCAGWVCSTPEIGPPLPAAQRHNTRALSTLLLCMLV